MSTFKVRYKTAKGQMEESLAYNTIDNWGKDNDFLYLSRKDSAQFLIVRKEKIVSIKLEK